MAETLLIAVLMLAAFVVLFVVDVHGKARAFDHSPDEHRPPEPVTSLELPAPHFNQRDNRRES